MVLVMGPARVGKTTFIRLLEERLLAHARTQMEQDPGFMPFSSLTTAGPDASRFDWQAYYKAVLRGLQDPFVDGKTASIPARELREAMETALRQRKPIAIIVDEAHHLAKATSGRRLQDQLDHLKYFENVTGVSHILVGTYELRPFRKVNAQLACRSVDVHFARYDATKDEEARVFRSVLWALQRQLPVLEEPRLVEHWEFLYARSIGCIGLLKMHLSRALNVALADDAKTVTLTHMRKTALESARVELALRNALESEADLTEPADADERLLTLLGLRGPRRLPSHQMQQPQAKVQARTPGKRAPGRDATGEDGSETATARSHAEQAAG